MKHQNHGMNSTLSQPYADGFIEARAIEQTKVFDATVFLQKLKAFYQRLNLPMPFAPPLTKPRATTSPTTKT